MSKNNKKKLNNDLDEKAIDFDFSKAKKPKNKSIPLAPLEENPKGDIVMQNIAKKAVKANYNMINVGIIFLFIFIVGLSFALLRNTDEYEENTNELTYSTFSDGTFTKKLSLAYDERLPGKQLLIYANRGFSYMYGFGKYNGMSNLLDKQTGEIINVKTYDKPYDVTLTTITTTTTTTSYTGRTANTTLKINGTLFTGVTSNLTTTTTTKKTTTKKTTTKKTTKKTTTTKTTTPSTTKWSYVNTSWEYKGATTATTQATTTATTIGTN